ncbi:MAG: asnB 5 [Hyphomicrobiales bacterium]|nr:asnB 5 [Hyphomicrobiales bacterium]
MCGIAGIITADRDVATSALQTMVAAQAHRGPDGSGEIYLPCGDSLIGLGHRRLAIIDLSENGAQPMTHPVTGDWLVYNGEIYNHWELRRELEALGCTFQGTSDSEVLLHGLAAWGTDCIDRLRGMFAFAYYKAATADLLLARDPLGIKPLYVGRSRSSFLFASEMRAILETGLVSLPVDARGLAGLFAYGALQHPLTLSGEVRSFPAGSWQWIRAGRREEESVRYWTEAAPASVISEDRAIADVRETISDAVRDHLISDVPVGVFLSSGLDSTIVAGLAGRHAPGLQSFTVAFAANTDLSEGRLAGDTARRFNLEHTECLIGSAEALEATTSWLQSIDAPSIDGLNVYIISKAVRERGIKVALSGQGGDELFGGYSSFADVPRLHRMMMHLTRMPAPMRRTLSDVATLGQSRTRREKAAAIFSGGGDLFSLYTQRRRLMSPPQLAALGFDAAELDLTDTLHDPLELLDLRVDDCDPIWTVSSLECRYYLGNMLLRDGDANSMAHGLEVRVPLLDRRLLDLASSLTGRRRLPSGRPNKYLLRRAFPDLLSADLLNQPKRGFTLPISAWMQGPLNDLCLSGLDYLKASGLVLPSGIDAVWDSFVAEPDSPAWSRAFLCCVIGLYLQQTAEAYGMRLAS